MCSLLLTQGNLSPLDLCWVANGAQVSAELLGGTSKNEPANWFSSERVHTDYGSTYPAPDMSS